MIPTVDISSFVSGATVESRQRVAREFATQCAQHGCLAIVGHGVSPDALHDAFALSKQLFDLPLEDKMKAPHPADIFPHRGFSHTGREKGSTNGANDGAAAAQRPTEVKESYEIGSDHNVHEPNIWLPEEVFPGFRRHTTELYKRLAQTADVLMELFGASLGLDGVDLAEMRRLHSGQANQLRLLHYPSVDAKSLQRGEISRLGAHTDWSYFTLLFQKDHGGLEFLDRTAGKFMPANPREGVVYMNVGDMITRLSNGRFPAAKHRVVGSEPDAHGVIPTRYSIAYFVIPAMPDVVAPAPKLVRESGQDATYAPVVFESYARTRFLNREKRSEDDYRGLGNGVS